MIDKFKEFKPSSWAIDNRTSIYILTIIITLAGLATYNALPKENFPEIIVPQIFVSTIYPGTSPEDMENLVAKPLEKQMKSISGVKKVTSNSLQDFSNIIVEFNTDVDVADAKQKVKDAVDRARNDLPTDLPNEPNVQEINFSDIPILFVNMAGDYPLDKLKEYSDDLKDKIESLKEITRVDIVGALEREIQIEVDMYKAQAAQISMRDIENAVAFENMTISGGTVEMDGMRRSVSVKGEFKDVSTIENIVIVSAQGAPIYLRDIARIKDGFKEQESYARLYGKNVITLNVVKRSGENLIEASDKIKEIISNMQENDFPKDLKITLTGDQSNQTRVTLHDLINTIIIGFILVTILLMFFMGATNALFVALSVPLSMFIAFLIMPTIGFTMNMIVLFSFLLALGIVVDDAIVVIENTHRIFNKGKVDIVTAAKTATGEVFLPVLSGTLTTLAPFVPLAFWKGLIGEFMFFLPITLIITLSASLVVAYIINPVFAASFMKPDDFSENKPARNRSIKIVSVILGSLAVLSYIFGNFGMGNFFVTLILLFILYKFVLLKAIQNFQEKLWPAFTSKYKMVLIWALKRPWKMILGTVALFALTIVLLIARSPGTRFFPQGEPNFIYVYLTLPVGTDQAYTDSITYIIEKRVTDVVGVDNKIVSSILSNVAVGVTDPAENDQASYPNRSKVTVAFVEFGLREGVSTRDYLEKIRKNIKGIPGAEISVDQEQGGPPVGKPINIEISGDKFEDLIAASVGLKRHLDSTQVDGVEELKTDLQNNKPEIVFNIDRERANREGISTGQVGSELRTAIFGKEISKFRDNNDEYDIMLRVSKNQRDNIDQLKNMKVTYRDMNMGGLVRQVPLSSFTDIKYSSTYAGIKRKNQKRVITLYSNVLSGYSPNDVVAQVQVAASDYELPEGVAIDMTGEQQEQQETMSFLGSALLISLGLIFLILVTQFNSVSKPLIILTEIVFSLIGVLLGYAIFGMEISIMMTGVGVVALAGIVVRNGILLVEFTDLLREQGMELNEAIVEAGKTRMTPVLLTATATMLGLIPLAVGLNMDFVKLFTELNPHIYFGGDSVAFWGPLSWTMIFGLSFSTFLTLILVPVMYMLSERLKLKRKGTNTYRKAIDGVPSDPATEISRMESGTSH
ncbi:MAG: efflux RND transporter permease subunit [Bacteroidetes bacterium]|nr:efflux RND transporter permease subunit [Bacteroidota bacterium]